MYVRGPQHSITGGESPPVYSSGGENTPPLCQDRRLWANAPSMSWKFKNDHRLLWVNSISLAMLNIKCDKVRVVNSEAINRC